MPTISRQNNSFICLECGGTHSREEFYARASEAGTNPWDMICSRDICLDCGTVFPAFLSRRFARLTIEAARAEWKATYKDIPPDNTKFSNARPPDFKQGGDFGADSRGREFFLEYPPGKNLWLSRPAFHFPCSNKNCSYQIPVTYFDLSFLPFGPKRDFVCPFCGERNLYAPAVYIFLAEIIAIFVLLFVCLLGVRALHIQAQSDAFLRWFGALMVVFIAVFFSYLVSAAIKLGLFYSRHLKPKSG
jgi:hypothetical protein